jgi:AraC-like DNA-binding protein
MSSAEANAGPRPILPDGCIDLILDLTRGNAGIVGAMTRAVVFDPKKPVRSEAVRFRPGGAVPFFGVSADELTDRVVESTEIIGARWLAPAFLDEFAFLGEAVRMLERCLLGRLQAIRAPDPIVAYAVSRLFGPAPPSIATLSRQTGWSRQHLGRVFRSQVGVTPKQLSRVARLQRAIDDLQRGRAASLADLALRLGYFDQAHMARDFRELAGVTPLIARASADSIFPIRSLFAQP